MPTSDHTSFARRSSGFPLIVPVSTPSNATQNQRQHASIGTPMASTPNPLVTQSRPASEALGNDSEWPPYVEANFRKIWSWAREQWQECYARQTAILLGKNRQLSEELERNKRTISGLQYGIATLQRQAGDWKVKTEAIVEKARKKLDAQEADLKQKAHEQEVRLYVKISQLGQSVDKLQKEKKVLEEEKGVLVQFKDSAQHEKEETEQQYSEELAVKQQELEEERLAHTTCKAKHTEAGACNSELIVLLAADKSTNKTLRTSADDAIIAKDKALAELQQATKSFEAEKASTLERLAVVETTLERRESQVKQLEERGEAAQSESDVHQADAERCQKRLTTTEADLEEPRTEAKQLKECVGKLEHEVEEREKIGQQISDQANLVIKPEAEIHELKAHHGEDVARDTRLIRERQIATAVLMSHLGLHSGTPSPSNFSSEDKDVVGSIMNLRASSAREHASTTVYTGSRSAVTASSPANDACNDVILPETPVSASLRQGFPPSPPPPVPDRPGQRLIDSGSVRDRFSIKSIPLQELPSVQKQPGTEIAKRLTLQTAPEKRKASMLSGAPSPKRRKYNPGNPPPWARRAR